MYVCKFSKNVLSKLFYIENSKTEGLDEVAHFEPPHQDQRCVQIQLFLSLALNVLMRSNT